jgi:hypothetical protein
VYIALTVIFKHYHVLRLMELQIVEMAEPRNAIPIT